MSVEFIILSAIEGGGPVVAVILVFVVAQIGCYLPLSLCPSGFRHFLLVKVLCFHFDLPSALAFGFLFLA